MQALVFGPLGMTSSGIDDDSPLGNHVASPHDPEGVYGLAPSPGIHWSAKAGNASVFVTAADQCRWMRALFEGGFLSPSSRAAMLDTSERVGYGWFRSTKNSRLGVPLFWMNGHSPGFSSAVLYLPEPRLSVVVLSNIYSSAPTTIGYDIADLASGKPVEGFRSMAATPNDAKLVGTGFRYGPKFYQPNVTLRVIAVSGGIGLEWGDKRVSPLIPVGADRFVDRSYWTQVVVKRGSDGRAIALVYDGVEGVAVE
jgi:CubicO group peptidase (beta-lactamase class C family)